MLPLGSAVRDLAQNDAEAAEYHALDELWQDGHIEPAAEGSWLVPFDRLLHVDALTANTLKLPTPDTEIHAELRSSSVATNSDFSIRLELSHPEHGRLDPKRQLGPAFVVTGGDCVLLTPDLWRLVVAVADAPSTDAARGHSYRA